MKIQFTTSVAGERFSYRFKQVADLRDDLAQAFIKAGQAVKFKEPSAARRRGAAIVETAIRAFTPEQRG